MGRLGFDGLRLLHDKVSPVFSKWRGETPTGLNAVEQTRIATAKQKAEGWLDGVKQAETAEATKYLEAHPPTKVEGEPGRRKADLEGGRHRVEEVPGGLGCELHSPAGTPVPCRFDSTQPPKPEEPAKPATRQRRRRRSGEPG
jgi:hypothetical protein